MKKLIILVLFFLLVFNGVVSSSDYKVMANNKNEEKIKIGVSFQEMNNKFFVVMKDSIRTAAATINAELVIKDAQHNVLKQINDIEDMINQGVDILLINATDTHGIEIALIEAQNAGLTILTFDADAKGPRKAYVASDNFELGYKAGEFMAEELSKKGQVAILNGIPTDGILDRVLGFKTALEKYPNIKIVDNQNGYQERNKAMHVTENMLQSNPNLDAIFSVNGTGALGCYYALKDAVDKDVFIVSIDGHPEEVEKILEDSKVFRATVSQFPKDIIEVTLGMALANYWGAEIPENIRLNTKLINKENAEGFEW